MARTCARGRRTSTPPCMMGAVIMKMISSTNATSTREVTLISAVSGSSPWPRRPPPPSRPAILEPPLAGHGADDLLGEPFELTRDQSQPVDEEVVGHHRGNRHREPRHGGDQRFGDARRHGRDVARAADGDPDE